MGLETALAVAVVGATVASTAVAISGQRQARKAQKKTTVLTPRPVGPQTTKAAPKPIDTAAVKAQEKEKTIKAATKEADKPAPGTTSAAGVRSRRKRTRTIFTGPRGIPKEEEGNIFRKTVLGIQQ